MNNKFSYFLLNWEQECHLRPITKRMTIPFSFSNFSLFSPAIVNMYHPNEAIYQIEHNTNTRKLPWKINPQIYLVASTFRESNLFAFSYWTRYLFQWPWNIYQLLLNSPTLEIRPTQSLVLPSPSPIFSPTPRWFDLSSCDWWNSSYIWKNIENWMHNFPKRSTQKDDKLSYN